MFHFYEMVLLTVPKYGEILTVQGDVVMYGIEMQFAEIASVTEGRHYRYVKLFTSTNYPMYLFEQVFHQYEPENQAVEQTHAYRYRLMGPDETLPDFPQILPNKEDFETDIGYRRAIRDEARATIKTMRDYFETIPRRSPPSLMTLATRQANPPLGYTHLFQSHMD